MSSTVINFKQIQTSIENWDEKKEGTTNSLITTNEEFKKWLGVDASLFKEKIQPSYIKKKLKKAHFQADLFNSTEENKDASNLKFTIIEWEAADDFLEINYNFQNSIFGEVLIASTFKGICWLAFIEEKEQGIAELFAYFPKAIFHKNSNNEFHFKVINQYLSRALSPKSIAIHSKGTAFQLKVWKALVEIELGDVLSYGTIAKNIKLPAGASRAVGTAIGKNKIALFIPCHRVVRSTGVIGDYRWGTTRKKALIGWEMLQS